jgi:thiamine-phosphate pyrophosphorylase
MLARLSEMLMPDALSRAKLARAARSLNAGVLALMTDDERLPDARAAARALPPASLVIVRARDAKKRVDHALALRAIAREHGLILLIADDTALARAIGAHGVHLPEARSHQAAHVRAQNPGFLITASAHSLRAVLSASHVDAVLLSPVFATESHRGAAALTPARARLIARGVKIPVFALGGITAQNASLLFGFSGLAGIGALT